MDEAEFSFDDVILFRPLEFIHKMIRDDCVGSIGTEHQSASGADV